MFRYFSTFAALIFSVIASHRVYADQHYVSVFSDLQLQSKIIWPLPYSNRWDLLDTFGPRFAGSPPQSIYEISSEFGTLKLGRSVLRYDFHAGINIRGRLGDPVVAVHRAVVHSVLRVNKLVTVVLKHWFNQDVFVMHSEESTRIWYTVYGNIGSSNVTKGQQLEAGDDVGTVGMAKEGSYDSVAQIHQELWIGALCTLQHGARKEERSSPRYRKYEPSVHPMVMFDQLEPWNTFQLRVKPAVSILQEPTPLQDGIFSVSAVNALLHINRYTFEVISANGLVRKENTLDLGLRHGMKGYTEESSGLFIVDQTHPYLVPVDPKNFTLGSASGSTDTKAQPLGYADASSHYWEIYFIVPHSWIGCVNKGEQYILGVMDVWNTEAFISHEFQGVGLCFERKS
mmetsp:Transcript_19786/g.57416  ORF Transcript_19786/g.57416 Transcript_19786/m.57416 type:complete len:399 (-) Transcript_19786:25-1221(-)